MNWFKTIIPLSITLGPHLALLGLLELSSKSTLEHSLVESNRKAQFSPITTFIEPSVQTTIEEEPPSPSEQVASEEPPPLLEHKNSSTKHNTNQQSSVKKTKRRQCNNSPFVSQNSTQSYTLDEAYFNHLLNAPKEASGLATLSWSTNKKGLIKGVKIKRIPCSSPLRAMGLTPGMMVTHINNQAVKSNTDLYKAYRTIKKSNSFTLSAKKQGHSIQRSYTISTIKK